MSSPAELLLSDELATQWQRMLPEVPPGSPREHRAAVELLHAALSLSLEMWFEKGDPTDPTFTEWEHSWRKFGGDNPGTVYATAPVDPTGRYRITGDAPGARYVGIQVYTRGPGYNAPSANLGDEGLAITDAGNFSVEIGGEAPADGRPWIPLVEDDYLVMVRVYRRDVFGPAPVLRIEQIEGGSGVAPTVDERADAAVAFLREAVLSTISVTDVLRAAGSNAYPAPDAPVHRPEYTGALFPTLDNVYDGCWVDLGPGELLEVRGRLPRARYSSFVWYDRWFATPDYRRVRCFRTSHDLVVDPDGSYTLFVGPDDPGHPNWIDSDGLTQGIFAIRCLLPEERSLPDLRVVRPG
jgi:hypothetical protein